MRWCGELPAQNQSVAWETALFANKEPNAFALPGGKVGVNTGIFTVAKNQDQLAAVLAHEIGHVVERHHDERITRQMGASGAVQLLGALAGGLRQPRRPRAAACWRRPAFLLPGSRVQESEADVVGQRLMAEAGFDPAQAVNLWQNMIAAGGGRPAGMAVHPPGPAVAHPGTAQPRRQLVPAYQQARAAGRSPKVWLSAVCCCCSTEPCSEPRAFLLALPPPVGRVADGRRRSVIPSRGDPMLFRNSKQALLSAAIIGLLGATTVSVAAERNARARPSARSKRWQRERRGQLPWRTRDEPKAKGSPSCSPSCRSSSRSTTRMISPRPATRPMNAGQSCRKRTTTRPWPRSLPRRPPTTWMTAAATIAYLKQAIEFNALDNNSHYQLMYMLAGVQLQEDQYAEGLATLDRYFAETKSQKPEEMALKGQGLYQAERYAEAIPCSSRPSKPRRSPRKTGSSC